MMVLCGNCGANTLLSVGHYSSKGCLECHHRGDPVIISDAVSEDHFVCHDPTQYDLDEAGEQGGYTHGKWGGYIRLGNGGQQCIDSFDTAEQAFNWLRK